MPRTQTKDGFDCLIDQNWVDIQIHPEKKTIDSLFSAKRRFVGNPIGEAEVAEAIPSLLDIPAIAAGTKVKIWTVSRFGDAGITSDFHNPTGYSNRVSFKHLKNIKLTNV